MPNKISVRINARIEDKLIIVIFLSLFFCCSLKYSVVKILSTKPQCLQVRSLCMPSLEFCHSANSCFLLGVAFSSILPQTVHCLCITPCLSQVGSVLVTHLLKVCPVALTFLLSVFGQFLHCLVSSPSSSQVGFFVNIQSPRSCGTLGNISCFLLPQVTHP